MNLFSQSKLTLKLKKPNSTLTTASANECQKQDISDPSKLENSLNNSLLSVNDSFVEVLPIPQPQNEQISMSKNVFLSSSNQNECSIKNENKPCPVCLVMISSKYFINHVKSCGTSHNVSPEVLMKAVDLQERQTAEREALGLPKVLLKKKKKKKTVKQLKIGTDTNLDLAIAMSASLHESKEAEIIRESETLLEAGLEKEAIEKRKTLECFGFVSNQSVKSKSKVLKANSILFKQTKEDREKRITEKIAMILVDSFNDVDMSLRTLTNCPIQNVESKYLNEIRNFDNKLWKKSSLEEENNESKFYVEKLSKFIIPCESSNFTDSTNILELSKKKNISRQEPNTSHAIVNNKNFVNDFITSPNIIKHKTMSEYLSKWKSMVGNQFMSDIVFITKDEHEIHAHILVLYVQCPDILNDIVVEESDSSKSKKIVMWLDYSYKSCSAFLEYIYSGEESFVSLECREDYFHLGRRYNVPMASDNDNYELCSKVKNNVSKRLSTELNNSPTLVKRFKASSPDMFMSNVSSYDFLETTVNDESLSSIEKTKEWLNGFNGSQQYPSSLFTENPTTNVSLNTVFLDTSSNHSFHSASTVSITTYIQNTSDHIDNNIEFEAHINSSPNIIKPLPKLSTDESSIKAKESRSVPCPVITRAGMPQLANSCKTPELIIITSDSESESISMSLSNNINEHHDNFLSYKTFEKQNLPTNSKNINTIELNDNSSDSIFSAITNILNDCNYDRKLHHSLFENSFTSAPRHRSLINIDDEGSVFSAVTNVISSSNNIKIIDLVEDSNTSSISATHTSNLLPNDNLMTAFSKTLSNNSQQSSQNWTTSFSNFLKTKIQNQIPELSSSDFGNRGTNIKTHNSSELDSNNFASNNILTQCENNNLKSFSLSPKHNNKLSSFLNTTSSIINHDLSTNNSLYSSEIFSIEKNDLKKSNIDSKKLKNNITSISLTLPCNNSDNSLVNTNNLIDLTNSSFEYIDNRTTVNTARTEVIHSQLPKNINTNGCIQDKIDDDQIIWLDDDWALNDNNISIENNSVLDKTKVQTLNYNNTYDNAINLDIEMPIIPIDYEHNPINFKKKNATTPNKYGCRINTPRSLRRVQSESIIGSKEQVTPLPDYSIMKTPDLRKEFDRYGLKNLGRRKGKLILEHIYDILHPSNSSQGDNSNTNTEPEQYSDLSDESQHGIPDYEDGSCDELETFSQTGLSNKTTVEMGFKQMLQFNRDLHEQILCYKPIWIEELKEDLKQYNVSISMQKLMNFLDDKCVTFRSRSLNNQRQKTLLKGTRRKKLF
ncbi:BTB/POZ domain,SKP1/BTB/POZ domain,Structure-specific endonuclease subunit Slx4 [Cinara cedri]|uniref:Structure-specific endonuclease subunit SLX4 n=1 Tax=Cinara cedri TaxID=506608 RepID=A0A5E4NGS5_9HEMI|nr:BTB/POZ domain,SKP1/BTB/POZ domain,Structure-specific endonuclease subunit Slx4 [Cinara cedri]